jgi:glycosyltransferase involved in cell wall biosynthesis
LLSGNDTLDHSSADPAPEAPSDRPEVSVVVVSKDEPELEHTLGLLEPQCRAIGAECIVVDASRGRLDAIRGRFPFVRWIDFVGPLGVGRTIAHQRNVGVRTAEGMFIAFADAGGAPAPDWLAEITAPLRAGRHSAVCGPIASLHPSPYPVLNDLEDGARVFRAVTCNMAFRREVFDAVGGFDERFADGEDIDFGWRAEDAGFGFVGASRARMQIDWGDRRRFLRRARLYGLASARLISTHTDRVGEMFRTTPDMFVYPIWELGLVASLILIPWLWWAPLAWLSLFLVPVVRNARGPQSMMRLRIHLTKAFWFWIGWVTLALDRRIPVAFTPKDRINPYQELLRDGLGRVGVAVDYLDNRPTPSRSLNTLLGPFRLGWRRLRGTKVVHVHYAYAFALPWTTRLPFIRRFPRWWMSTWMSTARIVGLRIVYTAHDLLQHRKTFDDDTRVQALLIRGAHAVICLSPAGRDDLRTAFPAVAPPEIFVVPMGPPRDIDANGRSESRRRLGIQPEDVAIVAAGRLESYKGFDLMLNALAETPPPEKVTVRLAGLCPAPDYRRVLEDAAERARAAGVDVGLDLRLLPEDDLEDLLLAGDIAVFPFRQITNSSSLNRAAGRRLAILIPDIPALRDVPDAAVARFDPNGEGLKGKGSLTSTLAELVAMSPTERAAMGEAAYAWTQSPSWEEIGASTREVYERVLAKRER